MDLPEGLPKAYNGEKVKITIEQDGKTTTIVDNEPVEFPYLLEWESESGSTGTGYVVITYDDGKNTTIRYDNITFRPLD